MGDDDELGLLGQIVQIARKPLHVPVVQSGVDFVQQAEGGWPHLQNGKVQCRCHKGLLAAGQQRDGLHLLSGGLHPNLNAAGQRVLRILQNQLALAAAEHFLKGLTEIMVDFPEFLHKNRGHFRGDIPDDGFQLPLGVQHVVPLGGKIAVALVHPGVFLDGAQIGGAQSGNLPFQFGGAAVACRHIFDVPPELGGSARGQAVGIPELVRNLPLFHGGGDFLLLQQGTGTLHGQDVLALVLGIPLRPGLGGLRLGTAVQNLL